jgi:hypothetical protein
MSCSTANPSLFSSYLAQPRLETHEAARWRRFSLRASGAKENKADRALGGDGVGLVESLI